MTVAWIPEPRRAEASFNDIDPLDFSYLDGLPRQVAAKGRLYLGHARNQGEAGPCLLFVHGAHHGAWCFAAYLAFFDALGVPSAALDLRGHGGLPQDADFCRQGVAKMAEDVSAACRLLGPGVIPVGHSAGALVAAQAALDHPPGALGLLTPSPPGNMPGAARVSAVTDCVPVPVPDLASAQSRYLDEAAARDVGRFHGRLCPESPALMNDRYGLRVTIDPSRLPVLGFCIAAERDSPRTHPAGQDRAVATFLGFEFAELAGAPHSFMLGAKWLTSALWIARWYARHLPCF